MTTIIDTYKSNKIKIDVIEMTANDIEMCVRWNNELSLVNLVLPEISLFVFISSRYDIIF